MINVNDVLNQALNAAPVRTVRTVSTTTARASGTDYFWYLKHEGDLAQVTSEASNPELGITAIDVFSPTQSQAQAGICAKVAIRTPIGTIRNISVMNGREGSLYILTPSRKVGDQYYSDVTLSRPVVAQILSYITTLLPEA